MSVQVTVLYFASLRDAAGVASERILTQAPDLESLYEETRSSYGFAFSPRQLRVAVNGEFAHWGTAPREGDEVAFIPPVSGG